MKQFAMCKAGCVAIAAILVFPMAATATIVPYEEAFPTGPAGWSKDSAGSLSLDWAAVGGSDGGGFVSHTFNFLNSPTNSTPPIFHGNPTASGGAFAGDWIADGVTEFSAMVKHEAGFPLTFFMRVAPMFGPGAVGLIFAPVPSGVWTPISWGIFPGNPQTIFEGTTFPQAFGNVARVQIGVITPAQLGGVDQSVTFSLDQPAVTPEPGTLALVCAGTVLVGVRTRRRR